MKKQTCKTCGAALVSHCPACAGRVGGRATGPTKARRITSEAARAAVNARWAKHRQEHPKKR